MAEIVVYTLPPSSYGQSVMAALDEKGLDWRLEPIAPGQQAQPPHLARHPFGKVPALRHDDFMLYETQAILRYIDRAWPAPALTPQDPRAAARMDQVMGVHDSYLVPDCSVIGFERVIKPMLLHLPTDEAAIAAAIPRAQRVFAELARLLGEQAYFAGETFSLADLMLVPKLAQLARTPEWQILTEDKPALVRYLSLLLERDSFRACR